MAGACVITVSDRCSRGEAQDRSGPALAELLEAAGLPVVNRSVVPDEQPLVVDAVLAGIDAGAQLIVTTGGTGLGPRDVTPQAVASILDYEVPGIGEEMRRAGLAKTPSAMLSRSLAGVRGRALILCAPGSVAGATESLEAVLPALNHALRVLTGDPGH